MSNDTQVVEQTQTVDAAADAVEQTQTVVEPNPYEQEAGSQGWVNKDEWVKQGKNPEDHRSAKEFVERGELYRSNSQLRREVKQTQAALDALGRHHKYVFEKAFAQAKEELTREKRAAIRAGDFDAVADIEQEIEEKTAQHAKEQAAMQADFRAAQQAGPPPELIDFVNRNQWYVNDPELRDEADAIGLIYLNKGGSREGLLAHVEKKIKTKFPEKFGVKKAAPNAVAAVNRTTRGNSDTDIELDEMEKQIMRTLVDTGTMTEVEYKRELKKVKARK